jgi:hypothetical protein
MKEINDRLPVVKVVSGSNVHKTWCFDSFSRCEGFSVSFESQQHFPG